MERPTNPYERGTLIWSLMEGGLQSEFDGLPGWDDLTISQIAEVVDSTYYSVQASLSRIKRETGYEVPRAKGWLLDVRE